MTAYKEIIDNKKKYLSLLLLADEQESMIDTYLVRGRLYVMEDDGVRAVCVVTDEGDGILEIKNLAVSPPWQRCGYGRAFVEYIRRRYRGAFHTLQVGTGDEPLDHTLLRSLRICEITLRQKFFHRSLRPSHL